jgi:hypothetical protein
MTRISKLTFVAAVIAALAASSGVSAQTVHHKRAHAQSYSFPTYAVQHTGKSPPKNTIPADAARGDSH